jgi:hypothetical protein
VVRRYLNFVENFRIVFIPMQARHLISSHLISKAHWRKKKRFSFLLANVCVLPQGRGFLESFGVMGGVVCSVSPAPPLPSQTSTTSLAPPFSRLVCRRAKSFACMEDMGVTTTSVTTQPVRPTAIQIPDTPKSASRTLVSRISIQLVSPTAISVRQKHVVARIYTPPPPLASNSAHVVPRGMTHSHTLPSFRTSDMFLLHPHEAVHTRVQPRTLACTQYDSDSDEEPDLSYSMRNWSIDSTSRSMGIRLKPWENGPLLYPSEHTILHMLKHRNSQAPQRLLDASTHKNSNALLYARFQRRMRGGQIWTGPSTTSQSSSCVTDNTMKHLTK